MQQKCKFGKTKLLTIFPYSQCCAGHVASLQISHDVTEPNLGPLPCTQESQSTDTISVVKESTEFTAGTRQGEQAVQAQKTQTSQWISGKGF